MSRRATDAEELRSSRMLGRQYRKRSSARPQSRLLMQTSSSLTISKSCHELSRQTLLLYEKRLRITMILQIPKRLDFAMRKQFDHTISGLRSPNHQQIEALIISKCLKLVGLFHFCDENLHVCSRVQVCSHLNETARIAENGERRGAFVGRPLVTPK